MADNVVTDEVLNESEEQNLDSQEQFNSGYDVNSDEGELQIEGGQQEQLYDVEPVGGQFEVVYNDDTGRPVKEIVTEQQLEDLWRDYRINGEKYQSYKTLEPLLNDIAKSDFLRYFLNNKAQGYTEEQIFDAYYMAKHPEAYRDRTVPQEVVEPEPEYFDTVADEIQYRASKIVERETKGLKAEIETLKSALNNVTRQNEQQRIIQHNDAVLAGALNTVGLNSNLSNEDLKILGSTITELYPNVDLSINPLNEKQAQLIVRAAFGNRNSMGKVESRNNTNQKTPVAIVGSKATGNVIKKPIGNIEARSKAERSRRIDELLG